MRPTVMTAAFLAVIAAALSAAALPAAAQEAQEPPCAAEEHRQLDFWVGTWDLSWETEGMPAKTGTNRIAKTLGGCVIEETFSTDGDRPFLGHSVSTFDRRSGQWRQTWVDNRGGYLPFTGGPQANGDFILDLEGAPPGRAMRMVFTEIEADSLTWHWQRSEDGGETWADVWVIAYTRAD